MIAFQFEHGTRMFRDVGIGYVTKGKRTDKTFVHVAGFPTNGVRPLAGSPRSNDSRSMVTPPQPETPRYVPASEFRSPTGGFYAHIDRELRILSVQDE